jgi:hypothetical protein
MLLFTNKLKITHLPVLVLKMVMSISKLVKLV